jgi:hypothetical protein
VLGWRDQWLELAVRFGRQRLESAARIVLTLCPRTITNSPRLARSVSEVIADAVDHRVVHHIRPPRVTSVSASLYALISP